MRSLADLFDGRSQLIVYHFMMGPEWEEGCPSCSFWSDTVEGLGTHLAARDVTFLCCSRAPLSSIEAYKRRMGWTYEWVSSAGSDFNFDFGVSFSSDDTDAEYNFRRAEGFGEEAPGLSIVALRSSGLFHTYSTHARGRQVLKAPIERWSTQSPMGSHSNWSPG